MIEFEDVGIKNIHHLYDLNRELAKVEGQEKLYCVARDRYKEIFLFEDKIAFGVLCYVDGLLAGFYIYSFRLASYSGGKVLYVEDMYLREEYSTDEIKMALVQQITLNAIEHNCCRAEMRVLHNYNIGFKTLNDNTYTKIEKWDVYRREL